MRACVLYKNVGSKSKTHSKQSNSSTRADYYFIRRWFDALIFFSKFGDEGDHWLINETARHSWFCFSFILLISPAYSGLWVNDPQSCNRSRPTDCNVRNNLNEGHDLQVGHIGAMNSLIKWRSLSRSHSLKSYHFILRLNSIYLSRKFNESESFALICQSCLRHYWHKGILCECTRSLFGSLANYRKLCSGRCTFSVPVTVERILTPSNPNLGSGRLWASCLGSNNNHDTLQPHSALAHSLT